MAKAPPTNQKHTAELIRGLVKTVVMAQGNIFIRELLRRKGLPVGATKEDFEANLLKAIENGELQLGDVTAWLDEVEGWGDQHVYLYAVPPRLAADRVWSSPDNVKQRLPAAQRKVWGKVSLEFPDKWALNQISFQDDILTYVWHERYTTPVRKPVMDRREDIGGDWYQFRAYLERPDRAVLRFVLHLKKRAAAVFMQIPVEGEAHKLALDMVRSAVESLVPWSALSPFSASDAIKNLDRATLRNNAPANMKSRKTRLTDAATYVEFATTSMSGGYNQSAAVRNVRRAVKIGSFAGNTGVFLYSTRTPTGLERVVTIELFGEERRIKLRAQLKAGEVWDILDLLRNAEQ